MTSSTALRGAVLALLLAPAMAFAQTASGTASIPPPAAAPPPVAAPATASPTPPLSAAAQAAVDKRIQTLQSQLGITAAQMPLWSAFAQAMRDNAASTEALFNRRAENLASMSATQNMHSYAEIARAYADATEHLATAFDSLYASLSETQKRAADTLFREEATAAAKPRARR